MSFVIKVSVLQLSTIGVFVISDAYNRRVDMCKFIYTHTNMCRVFAVVTYYYRSNVPVHGMLPLGILRAGARRPQGFHENVRSPNVHYTDE